MDFKVEDPRVVEAAKDHESPPLSPGGFGYDEVKSPDSGLCLTDPVGIYANHKAETERWKALLLPKEVCRRMPLSLLRSR